jgi:hypothetical protein
MGRRNIDTAMAPWLRRTRSRPAVLVTGVTDLASILRAGGGGGEFVDQRRRSRHGRMDEEVAEQNEG